MEIQYDFSGKVALVTGAGSGIGKATAQSFGAYGAKVVVSDAVKESGEETAHVIKQSGGDALFVQTDVSKAGEVEGMVRRAVDEYGRLDIGVNNAGIASPNQLTAEIEEKDFDRVIDVNLKGVWLCMKHEIHQMLKQGSGVIVNMSSTCGLIAIPSNTPYVVSKHGVNGLTKTAALEYAQAGIRINAVCPGVIHTPLTMDAFEDSTREAQVTSLHPIGRVGEAQEAANAVLWLASDASSFATGSLLVVDGGWTAH